MPSPENDTIWMLAMLINTTAVKPCDVANLFGFDMNKKKLLEYYPRRCGAGERPQGGAEKCKNHIEILHVLFFPDDVLPCESFRTSGVCDEAKCKLAHDETALATFLGYIDRSADTLDICMYLATCKTIANAVFRALDRGVKVRIICDRNWVNTRASQMGKFIQREVGKEFLNIDRDIVVDGSFNWSFAAVVNNNENMFIARGAAISCPFLQYFNWLWKQAVEFFP